MPLNKIAIEELQLALNSGTVMGWRKLDVTYVTYSELLLMKKLYKAYLEIDPL